LKPRHADDYDAAVTERCERVLVTVLGDIGPWSDRLILAGGLVPRYLIGELPEGARPHVGSTDVDLILALAMPDSAEAYRTLERNLRDSDFEPGDSSFQWRREVEGLDVVVEFLCETTEVERGRIHRPKDGHGSKLGALNVEGAELAAQDFTTVQVEAERLDDGGQSRIEVRVANLLPYVVLKIQSFQDRHERKDAYDLCFTIRNWPRGPAAAGKAASSSPVASDQLIGRSLELLTERFESGEHDGPKAYADFLARSDDERDQLQLESASSSMSLVEVALELIGHQCPNAL